MIKTIKFLCSIVIGIGCAGIFVFLPEACNNANDQSKFKRSDRDSVFTSAMVVFDIIEGEYKPVTALKIRFDNSTIDAKDSSRVHWFRDSMYQVRLSITDKDSTGKIIYDSLGLPGKKAFWQDVDKKYVLEDYNKTWPLEIKK
jgi:hypothetical protein